MEKEITIIEISADSLYLVVAGEKKAIDKLALDLNNNNDNIQYISVKIDNPINSKCDELSKNSEKPILPRVGIESAQCYAYAEGFNNDYYMLMSIESIDNQEYLGYLKFDLGDNGDPEKLILDWIKKKLSKIPKSIKKSLKPLTLVRNKEDILVFVAKFALD